MACWRVGLFGFLAVARLLPTREIVDTIWLRVDTGSGGLKLDIKRGQLLRLSPLVAGTSMTADAKGE